MKRSDGHPGTGRSPHGLLAAALFGAATLAAAGSASADEPAAAPPADASAPTSASNDREVVRIGVAGGAGVANEPDARDRGSFGVGTADVHLMPIEGLDIGATLDVLSYGRDYVTTMPDGNGAGSGLRVHTDERMVRGRLSVGYEVLHFVVDDQRVTLTPRLAVDLTSFVNSPFPQMPISVGGGLALEAEVHDSFRLLSSFDYVHVVNTSRPTAQDLLYFGPMTGDMRFDLGFAYVASPTARLELRYRGEVQIYEHDARALHAVIVGPSFSIR